MESTIGFGLCAVLLGGAFQGSVFLPMKFTQRWQWENTWAVFSSVAYLLSPWALACLLVPNFPQLLWSVDPRALIATMLFGAGMGCGALMMGLAYRYVGMAITFAIVLGISSSIGSLVPLLVFAPGQVFQRQGIAVLAGIVIGLAGTALVAWAAWERDAAKEHANVSGHPEAKKSTQDVVTGLCLSIASGLLSSCGNLGFAFGNQISQRSREMGAGSIGASSATWAVILLPVFLCNFVYSLHLIRKNKSAHLFRETGTIYYWALGILMAVDWMAGMTAYGAGALSLGKMGTSMGWILFVSSMIIVANILGTLTGEWKGSRAKTLLIMVAGITTLMAAIIVVGMAGTSA